MIVNKNIRDNKKKLWEECMKISEMKEKEMILMRGNVSDT